MISTRYCFINQFSFQTNRNVENNNFRSISQANSYANFNFNERQNDYEYNNSTIFFEKKIEYNYQSFRSTQCFIFERR